LDIQDLLNADFEKLAEIKDKCKKYIEILNGDDININNDEEQHKLLLFLAEKLKVNIL